MALAFYILSINIYTHILNQYKIFVNIAWCFPSANISALIQHSPHLSPLLFSIGLLTDRILKIFVILLLGKL